jgi:hypothetical protein
MATLPAYGPAVWTDWTDNWRKADGDFLQYRGILRYDTNAGKPATGQVGQVIYTVDNSRLHVWSTQWVQVLSSENMTLVTSGAQARFAHPSSGGSGLLFSSGPNLITSEVDFKGGQIQADTLAIYTAAGGGNRTARLTTTAPDLVSDSPILAPSLTLNSPVTAATPHTLNISSGTLKVAGAATFDSTVTAAGAVQGSSVIISSDQVLAINAATRKDYVDTQRDTRVAKTGDTMTGMLTLPATVPTGANHATNKTYVDTKLAIAGGGITGNLAVNGTFYGMNARIGGDGGQVYLIDTVSGGYDTYMAFYGNGTTSAPGTRAGYFGYAGNSLLGVHNEVSGGIIRLLTTGAGDILLQPGTGGEIWFSPSSTFQGKMIAGAFLWGKSSSDVHNAGLELQGAGSGGEGRLISTTSTVANLYCHHIGTVDAANAAFVQFLAGTTTILLSEIRQNAARNGVNIVNCTTSAPSDYRWKNDLGSIPDALGKVMQLRPRKLEWKASGDQFEGFLAHEADEVVPYLVDGEKDAVTHDGEIDGQGVNYGGLTPLLTAAIQELTERVTALEGAA